MEFITGNLKWMEKYNNEEYLIKKISMKKIENGNMSETITWQMSRLIFFLFFYIFNIKPPFFSTLISISLMSLCVWLSLYISNSAWFPTSIIKSWKKYELWTTNTKQLLHLSPLSAYLCYFSLSRLVWKAEVTGEHFTVRDRAKFTWVFF